MPPQAGDGRKQLFTRLEQLGKKNAHLDYVQFAKSLVLKGRLRRAYGAVTKGVGLREQYTQASQQAAKVVPQQPMQRGGAPVRGVAAQGMPQQQMMQGQ